MLNISLQIVSIQNIMQRYHKYSSFVSAGGFSGRHWRSHPGIHCACNHHCSPHTPCFLCCWLQVTRLKKIKKMLNKFLPLVISLIITLVSVVSDRCTCRCACCSRQSPSLCPVTSLWTLPPSTSGSVLTGKQLLSCHFPASSLVCIMKWNSSVVLDSFWTTLLSTFLTNVMPTQWIWEKVKTFFYFFIFLKSARW